MSAAYPMLTFYLFVFWTAFFFKIPAGPVNLDIFHHAVKKHYPQAIFIAAGAAIGDGIWAICAFLGISPFISHPQMEATLLVITAVITACLGFNVLRNSKFMKHHDEAIAKKVKRKRWSFVKGFTFVIINPLIFVSWVITLSFLRKSKIYIPHELNYEILLFYCSHRRRIIFFTAHIHHQPDETILQSPKNSFHHQIPWIYSIGFERLLPFLRRQVVLF